MKTGRPLGRPPKAPSASWWLEPMTRQQFEATAKARADAAHGTRAAALVDGHWKQIGEEWRGRGDRRGV